MKCHSIITIFGKFQAFGKGVGKNANSVRPPVAMWIGKNPFDCKLATFCKVAYSKVYNEYAI